MLEIILSAEFLASLLTLTALEIVLGIDNLVVLGIAVQRLPPEQRVKAQRIGLSGALIFRIIFLFALSWIVGLTSPIFTAFDHTVSWRDLMLLMGGLFLLWKGVQEIHQEMEGEIEGQSIVGASSLPSVIFMIMVIDVIFAMDSIITAIGLTQMLSVMIMANIIAILTMMFLAQPISRFIEHHITIKMLALAFVLLIGVVLVAEGLHFNIPRGYIYFAITFSLGVETLNIILSNRRSQKKNIERARNDSEG